MAHDMRDQDRLKSAVIERVADLAAEKHLGLAMILAGFDILTAPHRDLPDDPAVLALIQENYPDATQALVRNRALDSDLLAAFADTMGISESEARKYVAAANNLSRSSDGGDSQH